MLSHAATSLALVSALSCALTLVHEDPNYRNWCDVQHDRDMRRAFDVGSIDHTIDRVPPDPMASWDDEPVTLRSLTLAGADQ
jgi:hypothetical protein